MATVEGKIVSVGDWVHFKSDCEQGGEIIKIQGNNLTLKNVNRFTGGYIGGQDTTTVHAADCWLED
jgi:hypothetical protein